MFRSFEYLSFYRVHVYIFLLFLLVRVSHGYVLPLIREKERGDNGAIWKQLGSWGSSIA